MTEFLQNWEVAIEALGALLASGLIGLGAHALAFSLIKRLARRTPSDASSAWDLRCHVREKLLAFIQNKHPESLPRLRAELASGRGQGGE